MKLYQSVIEDTINGSREFFAEEGIDDQILMELRQSWESKVMASKAIDAPPPQEVAQLPKTVTPTVVKQTKSQYTPTIVNNSVHQLKMAQQQKIQQQQQQQPLQSQMQHQLPQQLPQQQQLPHQQQQKQQPQQQQNTIVLPADYANKYVPIQITLPAQTGSQETGSRILSIQVPSSAIQGNMLQSILSGQVITNSMAMTTPLATSFLQQHVNSVLAAQSISSVQTVVQPEFLSDVRTTQQQQQQQLQQNNQAFISGNEPLNSGDDVSDIDNGELFETENVIVCQYDKITRSRNKWKLYFKDGIMSLNGYDYVFQKATGDAEW
ncbi:hypothetical protein ACI65C_000387 [Semiaphis heraclei]